MIVMLLYYPLFVVAEDLLLFASADVPMVEDEAEAPAVIATAVAMASPIPMPPLPILGNTA